MIEGKNTNHEVYPYLRVKGAEAAVEFYTKVFGAKERFRLTDPGGKIGHVELDLGNIILMVSDEFPEYDCYGPQNPGKTGFLIHIHCDDCDELAARALAAGAIMIREAADHFYGERYCTIRDPFGHVWMLGHEIEKVEPEEMQRRYDAMCE